MSAIKINNHGPIKVEGDFQLSDSEGKPYGLGGRSVIFLCRCGLSKTKPFCDGAHKGQFEHEAVPYALPEKKA